MSNEVLFLAGLAVVLVLSLAYFLYRKFFTEEFITVTARAIIPDFLEKLIEPVILQAYQAVEQRVSAYGAMTNDERLELGKKYAAAIYEFYQSGNLTPEAIEAFLESLIFGKKHEPPVEEPPVEPLVEAVK